MKKRRAKYGAYGVYMEQYGGWWKGQEGRGRIDTRVAARDSAREQDALHAIYVCHRGGVFVARIPVYASWPLNIDRTSSRFRAGMTRE